MPRTITLALAAPVLLIATSCASPSDDGAIEVRSGEAATQTLRSAPDAATEAGTVSIEMIMEMSFEGQTLEMVATGAMDNDAGQMSMEMDMGAMFSDLAEETGESIPPGFDEPMRVVADGTTMYMQIPFAGAVGGPSGWLSMDLSELGMADQLGAGAYDMRSTLETLRGTSGEPEVVGTDEVRGVSTTHYRATIDLAEAIEAAPESARAALEQLGEQDGVEMVIDIWIDDEGLPRRQQMDMGSMLGWLGMGDSAATVTIDYYGYGEPVDIVIPSPDEVTPFSDLMGVIGDAFGESS